MLNGGRILHHLKKRLPDERNGVLFCGYQAEGTKGRFLQDNASSIQTLRIHHAEVSVEAEITTMASLSAHADWKDMIALFSHESLNPKMILLNHGEPTGSHAFATRLKERFAKTDIKVIDKPQLVKLA
jgi:metallo-beta-lactamase family protein